MISWLRKPLGSASAAAEQRPRERSGLKLVLAYNSGPFEENIGGVRRKMRFLTKQAIRNGAQVRFVGVKMGERDHTTPDVEFIPLFKADSLKAMRYSWLYLLLSLIRAPFLRLEPSEIVHVGRLIFLLPYCIWYPGNPKVCNSDMPQAVAARRYPHWLFLILSAVYGRIEAFIIKRTNAILAPPHVLRDYYLARYPQFKGKFRFDIDPGTGVDVELFQPRERRAAREELGISVDEKVVLFVGRLDPVKGVDFLIDSFAHFVERVHRSRFLVVGEDWMKGYYHQYAQRYPKCQIDFLGEKRGLELAAAYSCADLLVLGSVYEGNPTVVREALCTGLPVVSTDVGDVRLLLNDRRMGEVVLERDPETFADAMLRVSLIPPEEAKEACLSVATQVSEQAIFKSFLELYDELLPGSGSIPKEA